MESTEGENHSTEGRFDTVNETKGERDEYEKEQVKDSIDTIEGGGHRIEGGAINPI